MQSAFNSCDEFDECFNDALFNFCKNHCADCSDFGEPEDIISVVKIKNKSSGCKISKFTLQIYERFLWEITLLEVKGFSSR